MMVSWRSLKERVQLRCNSLVGLTLVVAIAVLVFLKNELNDAHKNTQKNERDAHKKLRQALEGEVHRVQHLLHHLPFPCTERGQVMTQVSPLIVSSLRPDAAPLVPGAVRQMPPVRVAACTATLRGETKRETPPDAVSLATVVRPSVYGINLTSNSPHRLLIRGAGPKHQVGPILSTTSNAIVNKGPGTYRVAYAGAWLDYHGIEPGESVESDLCLTIMPADQKTSLSSGEEVFCNHEHFDTNDPNFRRTEVFRFDRHGGFLLKPGWKAEVASVSQVYSSLDHVPTDIDEVVRRVQTRYPNMTAVHYELLVVKEALMSGPPLRSARSPLRDRSVFYLPRKETSSYTTYTNVCAKPVVVQGIADFQSMLTHAISGEHVVRVLVDGVVVHQDCPAPHRPHIASAPFRGIVPFTTPIAPNSTIAVKHSLVVNEGDAPAFDFASYVLYNSDSSELDRDCLVPYGEQALGGGKLDLNSDGENDFVDYDEDGNIWAELTLEPGVHDTQHAMFIGLRTKHGLFDAPGTRWSWSRDPTSHLMSSLVERDSGGLCFRLRPTNSATFKHEYCQHNPAVPNPGPDEQVADGDFDSDGFFDRIRLQRRPVTSDFALWFAAGNGTSLVGESLVMSLRLCDGYDERNGALMTVWDETRGRHVLAIQLQTEEGGRRTPWFEFQMTV